MILGEINSTKINSKNVQNNTLKIHELTIPRQYQSIYLFIIEIRNFILLLGILFIFITSGNIFYCNNIFYIVNGFLLPIEFDIKIFQRLNNTVSHKMLTFFNLIIIYAQNK